MNYQQLHAGKVKLSGLAGIRHHLLDRNRVKTNPDIDLARSHLNHSIEDLSPKSLISDVHQRIKQLQLKRKKPRQKSVTLNYIVQSISLPTSFLISTQENQRLVFLLNLMG